MGIRADAYESLIRASFPAHLFTTTATAFFRAICVVAEKLEADIDAAQAQAFIDTATGIWLRVRAWERQVPYSDVTSDEALREQLRQNEDTVTPNGMLAAVRALATYGNVTWTNPDTTAQPAEYFEPWNDGGYFNASGSEYAGKPGPMFFNAKAAILGPLGTASFEFVLPGLDLENGNYLHDTGAVYGTHDTGGPNNSNERTSAFFMQSAGLDTWVTGFLTQPDYAAWEVVTQIFASLDLWRAYGVPAYAQLRQTPDGGIPDPFFRQGLALYSTAGAVSEVFNDAETDGLESDRCIELDATAALAALLTGEIIIQTAGHYRLGLTARSTLAAAPGISLRLKNNTQGKWWNPVTREYQGGEPTDTVTISRLRDRLEPLIRVPIEAGDSVTVKVHLALATNTTAVVYHLGMFREAA